MRELEPRGLLPTARGHGDPDLRQLEQALDEELRSGDLAQPQRFALQGVTNRAYETPLHARGYLGALDVATCRAHELRHNTAVADVLVPAPVAIDRAAELRLD